MRFEMKDYADFQKVVRELTAFLAAQKLSENNLFDSKLVVHELLGNVLQHSGGGASMGVEVGDGYIRFTLRSENGFRPPTESKRPDCYAERGRGLYLVDSVCAERVFTEEGELLIKIRIE